MKKSSNSLNHLTEFVFVSVILTLILLLIGFIFKIPDNSIFKYIVLCISFPSVLSTFLWMCIMVYLIKKDIFIDIKLFKKK